MTVHEISTLLTPSDAPIAVTVRFGDGFELSRAFTNCVDLLILDPPYGKILKEGCDSLIEIMLRASSSDGDLVLDPMAGSGVTGVACEVVGHRRCVLFELDPICMSE